MKEQPLVSIVTIVYNGEKHLEQAMQSVLQQTYPNIEYIVIDGGSKDGTISIIKKYEQQLASWISEKDKGISDAFNKGLQKATGKFIGMINADDWYEKNAVEEAVKNFDDADIVYGDLILWRDDKIDFRQKGDHSFIEKEMTINHPTVFVRKTAYDQFGLFDRSFRCAMDYELLVRLWVNKCQFKYVPSIKANMRWQGLSDAQWKLGVKETLRIKNKYFPQRKVRHQLYYYKHLLAIAGPKALEKAGLGSIVKGYRSFFSRVKKVYKED